VLARNTTNPFLGKAFIMTDTKETERPTIKNPLEGMSKEHVAKLIVHGVAEYGAQVIVAALAKGLVKMQPNLPKKVAVAIAIIAISSAAGNFVGNEAVRIYLRIKDIFSDAKARNASK
jgi:hypothetical protein